MRQLLEEAWGGWLVVSVYVGLAMACVGLLVTPFRWRLGLPLLAGGLAGAIVAVWLVFTTIAEPFPS